MPCLTRAVLPAGTLPRAPQPVPHRLWADPAPVAGRGRARRLRRGEDRIRPGGTRRSALLHPDGRHDMHLHARVRDDGA
ncbi:hypothetical protein SUDANB6_04827 [Streptomyces sp. enrichment culture]